jgi:hypothetical protein
VLDKKVVRVTSGDFSATFGKVAGKTATASSLLAFASASGFALSRGMPSALGSAIPEVFADISARRPHPSDWISPNRTTDCVKYFIAANLFRVLKTSIYTDFGC